MSSDPCSTAPPAEPGYIPPIRALSWSVSRRIGGFGLSDNGKAFVEKKFAGRLSEPFSTHDADRLAVFGVDGRGRVGSFLFRYRVEPAGSKAGRAVVDLYAEAVWIKPRFLADSFKAGLLIQDAKRGLWGHAEEQFEAAPD